MSITLEQLVTDVITIELPDIPKPSANGVGREAPPAEDGPTCVMCGGPMVNRSGGTPKQYCSDACKQTRYRRDKEGAELAKRRGGRALEWEGAKRTSGKERPICACGCKQPVAIGKTLKYLMYASENCKHRTKRRKRKGKNASHDA